MIYVTQFGELIKMQNIIQQQSLKTNYDAIRAVLTHYSIPGIRDQPLLIHWFPHLIDFKLILFVRHKSDVAKELL